MHARECFHAGVVFESVPRENQSWTVSNRQIPMLDCHRLILTGLKQCWSI